MVLVLCLLSNVALYCTCIKFHENISKGFRDIDGLLFPYSGFLKGHDSVKTVCRVMVLVLYILSDLTSYLYKVS